MPSLEASHPNLVRLFSYLEHLVPLILVLDRSVVCQHSPRSDVFAPSVKRKVYRRHQSDESENRSCPIHRDCRHMGTEWEERKDESHSQETNANDV